MTKKFKKALSSIKGKISRGHKHVKEKVPKEALTNFNDAADFIIERHKETIKELEKH